MLAGKKGTLLLIWSEIFVFLMDYNGSGTFLFDKNRKMHIAKLLSNSWLVFRFRRLGFGFFWRWLKFLLFCRRLFQSQFEFFLWFSFRSRKTIYQKSNARLNITFAPFLRPNQIFSFWMVSIRLSLMIWVSIF